MVRIVSDSSTLYSSTQAREAGFAVSALSVTIAGKTYREFDEISSEEFVEIINQGHMPTSSQPAIGEVTALYEEFGNDEILNIAMADTACPALTKAPLPPPRSVTTPITSPSSIPGPSAALTGTWCKSAWKWPIAAVRSLISRPGVRER